MCSSLDSVHQTSKLTLPSFLASSCTRQSPPAGLSSSRPPPLSLSHHSCSLSLTSLLALSHSPCFCFCFLNSRDLFTQQFWRPEVCNPGMSRTELPLQELGERWSLPLPASSGSGCPLASVSQPLAR